MAEEKTKEEKKEEAPKEQASNEEEKKEEKTVEVPEKFKSLVSEIEKMSVMDLAELVKILEDKFAVTAAAPIVVAGGAASGEGEDDQEEQSTFNVELAEAGDNKIGVIKAVREITQIGLKDAKDMVDSSPKVIKEGAAKEEAEEIKKKLEEAGAKVNLK